MDDAFHLITALPHEILAHIFTFLDVVDLIKCYETCAEWRSFLGSSGKLVWRTPVQRHEGVSFTYLDYHVEPCASDYMSFLNHRDQIHKNWLSEQYSQTTYDAACGGIPYFLRFQDEDEARVIAALSDHTLKVVNIERFGAAERVFRHHRSDVNCFHLGSLRAGDDILMSGSADESVCIWKYSDATLLHVLQPDVGQVRCVQFDDAKILMGGESGDVLVFDRHTMKPLSLPYHLEHDDLVEYFRFQGNTLASASWDGKVRLFDLRTGLVTHVLDHSPDNSVFCLDMDFADHAIVTASNFVSFWDVRTACILQTLGPPLPSHEGHYLCVQMRRRPWGDFVAASSNNGRLHMWNAPHGSMEYGLARHVTPNHADAEVYSLVMDESKLVSGSNRIVVCDFEK